MIKLSGQVKRGVVYGTLGIILGLMVACRPSGETVETKVGDRQMVLASFTVLADMAQQVAGDKAEVISLVRTGAEIHGYEPTPQDIRRAQEADLILVNGLNLEKWLDPFLANVKNVPMVVVTDGLTPVFLNQGNTPIPNPHGWISPKQGLIYVDNIRDGLIALDPANAATYRANAEAYKQQLTALDRQFRQTLEKIPPAQRGLVTCEGAFSYLAQDYGLTEIYLWPINSDQGPTPQQIKGVIEQVKSRQVPTVFCETTVSPKAQEAVVRATDATLGSPLYVDSLSPPDGPVPSYLTLLTHNLQAIATGLTASSPN